MTIQNLIPNEAGNGSLGLTTTPWGAGVFNEGIFNTSVGIGTTSPDAPLHIVGTPSSTLILERDSADASAISSVIFKDGSDDQVRISSTDSKFLFETGAASTPRMVIEADGNVGIGTTSPQHILDVRSSEDLTTFVGNQTPGVGIKNEDTTVDNVALLAFKASQANTVLAGVGMINRNVSPTAGASIGDLAFYVKPSGASNLNDNPSMIIDSAGNVGIGTTSPAATAKLDVNGRINAESLLITANSSIGLGIQNTDNTNSAYIKNIGSSNETLLSIDDKVYVKENGNVGIGTTSPTAPLHVLTSNTTDTLLLESTGDSALNAPDLVLYRNSATPLADDKLGVLKFRGKHSGGGTKDYANIQGIIVDPTNTTEESKLTFEVRRAGAFEPRMEVGPDKVEVSSELHVDGNVGIGTTSPNYKLEVQEATNSTYAAKIFNNGGDSYGLLVKTSSGTDEDYPILDLENASSNVFRVQANGNVGIGTPNPQELLTIRGGGTSDYNAIRTSLGGVSEDLYFTEWRAAGGFKVHRASGSAGNLTIGIDTPDDPNHTEFTGTGGHIHFKTNSAGTYAERMVIDRDGNVGIGTTSPTQTLDVRTQAVVGNGTDGVKITYSTDNSSGIIDTGFSSTALEFRTGNSFAALIDSSGNVGIGTTTPGAFKLNVAGNAYIGGDLTVLGKTITEEVETITTSNGVVFEGSAADDHELTLKAGALTSDKTITLPDKTGTVALTSDVSDSVHDTPVDSATAKAISSNWAFDNVKTAVPVNAVFTDTTYSVGDGGLTQNNFTNTLKNKLDNIAAGAEVNVQADWSETSNTSDAFIKNKPTSLPPASHSLSSHNDVSTANPGDGQVLKWNGVEWAPAADTDTTYSVGDGGLTQNNFTNTLKNKLDNIAAGAEVNVQADWSETSNTSDAFIKNKPTSLPPASHSLSSHNDVSTANPGDGQVLKWNGVEWAPAADNAGTTIGSLNDIGGVTISSATDGDALVYNGTNWVNSQPIEASFFDSDESLKDGISEISDATNKLKSIKGVDFTWNESAAKDLVGKKDVGVIAQDIEKVIPEAVKSNDDGILSVQYHKIIPLLIETIKDQEKRISELEKRI